MIVYNRLRDTGLIGKSAQCKRIRSPRPYASPSDIEQLTESILSGHSPPFVRVLTKNLGHLSIHLVGIGGADPLTYERYGYGTAMKTQIDEGILDIAEPKCMCRRYD